MPAAAEAAVRRRAQPDERGATPVRAVVPGAPSGTGGVGYLVVLVALADERPVRREKLGGIALLVDRGHLAPLGPPGQRGVILDREAVEREVIGGQGEWRPRGRDSSRGPGRRAARRSGRATGRRCPPTRRASTAGATCSTVWVRCIHRRTDGIERLHPERDPVHSSGAPGGGGGGRDVVGIGLEGDLGAGGDGALARETAHQTGDGAGLEVRGSSAAEVHGVQRAGTRPRLDGTARPAIPAAPRPHTAARAPGGGPRSRNRSSCTAGRRTGRGCRGAPVKYARDGPGGGPAADAALFRGIAAADGSHAGTRYTRRNNRPGACSTTPCSSSLHSAASSSPTGRPPRSTSASRCMASGPSSSATSRSVVASACPAAASALSSHRAGSSANGASG